MQPSRHLFASLALATIFSAQISVQASAQTPGNAGPSHALQSAGVEITRSPQTGLVTWMSGSLEQPVARSLGQAGSQSVEQAAASFLSSQAASFGLRSGSAELAATRTSEDESGRAFVRFQQKYQDIPILGAELNVQLDGGRNVVSVNGKSVGDLNLSVKPDVSADDALKTAITATARARKAPEADLSGSTPALVILDPRVMGGPAAAPALVWRVDVKSNVDPEIFELVLVNAQNGRIAVQFSQINHAAPPANAKQWVCDAANTASKYPCTQANAVSSPGSSSVADVKNAFKFAENTYDFYAKRFGRNSLDNKGLRLVSTTRFRDPDNPGSDFANAFWSSDTRQMVYGKNYASALDVVGHELSHGFTNFTSNLFYYYQSGSINESLSDTFGELIQRSYDGTTKWLMGEKLPDGAIRSMKNPPLHNQPDKMTSTLWTEDPFGDDTGGVHTNSGVGNKATYLITDGATFNGKTVNGIGVDKALAIYYRVNTHILQSASDYADLGNALKQACKDLTGTNPKNNDGQQTAKITANDCKEVGKAVAATEMNKQPQYWPIPAEAAVCSGTQQPANKLFEKFEAANTANFKFQPSDGHWSVQDFYASSNKHAIWGSGSGQFDTNVSSTAAVAIPTKAFLRFAHYYNFLGDSAGGYGGGVVEYQVGGGAWKRVPPSMFLNNPYNATLKAGTGNVLAGQKAFSGFSGGWTSSRIDLSSLAGKQVKFRFRVATDFNGAFDRGWMLDDVRIYTCKASSSAVAAAE